ncbi:MAG TPA: hypothetical protein VK447_19690, partial [Myxococcaceae bacterium]|nr:hypothetical protein [Myxococcaceae bacterium]
MKWTLALLLLLGGCAPVRSVHRGHPELPVRQPRPEALAARMLLAAAPPGTPVPYDRFCDADGNITADAEVIAMLGRPGELDAIYEDALRGDARATRFLRRLEVTSEASARKMAEYVSSPECAVLPVLRRCQPTWALLAPLEGQGRGAARLRQVTQDAYEQRLRELVPQRALNRAALDMLMAMGPVGKVATALENEARAGARLARERTAGALERQQGTAKVAAASAAGLEALEKSSGLSREALAAKLAEAEAAEVGPRLSADLGALEKLRPSVEKPPAGVPEGTLWREYVGYWETRFSELGRARTAPAAAAATRVKPPLTWVAYHELRSTFARGIEFQRTMTAQLRADAALPMEQRT